MEKRYKRICPYTRSLKLKGELIIKQAIIIHEIIVNKSKNTICFLAIFCVFICNDLKNLEVRNNFFYPLKIEFININIDIIEYS